MVETSGQAHPKQTTYPFSGEFVSPFEVIGKQIGYSSSDESTDKDICSGTRDQSRVDDLEDIGSRPVSLHSSASTMANNDGNCLEGTLIQPRSIAEKVQNISVVSISRNNMNPAIGVDEIICELERLGVNNGGSYEGQNSPPRPEDRTCEESDVVKEHERASSDSLGSQEEGQESLAWITELQVNWLPIGQGSYGKVYRAVADDQVYALKIAEASSTSQLRKLAAEAHANMRLKHENVVHCHRCCFMTKGQGVIGPENEESVLELWLLQELCEGGTLDEAVRGPTYPPGNDRASRERILTNLSEQIAKGLEYIHSHGQIHGDLSSNNVLLGFSQEYTGGRSDPTMWEHVSLKISDFGRSKEKGVGSCRTDSIGTVTFMPPEALTTGSLRPSSDIYAYGVILMHLWTGALPYQGCNFAQIIFQASQGRTPQISPDMDAPELIKSIMRRCMSPLPADRPTATEILGMLNGVGLVTVTELSE